MDKDTFVSVSDINTLKELCNIKVRIIRLWRQPYYGNVNDAGSIEMVLMDEEGNKIQASVKRCLTRGFESVLVEGGIRIISNFYVAQNVGLYKIVGHPCKINFHKMTMVKTVDDFVGSFHGFNFVPFPDIVEGRVVNNQTVDVIGHVIGIGEVIPGVKNGVPNKRLELHLEDLEGVRIRCTMWDDYVDQLVRMLKNEPLQVLAIQFARLNEWRGNFTVSHGYYATRLFLNSDVSGISEFMNSLKTKYGEDTPNLKLMTKYNESMDSSPESFFSNSKCVKLDQFSDIVEVTSCIVVATITAVQTEQSWYYVACRKCNRKVIPEDQEHTLGPSQKKKPMYKCFECGPHIISAVPRFKVQIRVSDETASASLLLFDRDVMKLIGKTAHMVKESFNEKEEEFPEDLNAMIGKKILFKIEVTDYNLRNNYEVYTVSKMTENHGILKAFYKISEAEMENAKYEEPTDVEIAIEKKEEKIVEIDDAPTTQTSTSSGKRPIADVEKEKTFQCSVTKSKRKVIAAKKYDV